MTVERASKKETRNKKKFLNKNAYGIKFRISYFKVILHYVKAKLKSHKTKISRHSNITMIHLTKMQRFFLPKQVKHMAS